MLHPSKEQIRRMVQDNKRYPKHLVGMPREVWPYYPIALVAVWRSCDFLVQVFEPRDGGQRLTINRLRVMNGQWLPDITWDELQRLKSEAGFSDRWAVEIFPPDEELVNVSNMRHLWLLPDRPTFAWYKGMTLPE